MNFDTQFPQINEILQPVESSISTIVSMKYASTDISTMCFQSMLPKIYLLILSLQTSL